MHQRRVKVVGPFLWKKLVDLIRRGFGGGCPLCWQVPLLPPSAGFFSTAVYWLLFGLATLLDEDNILLFYIKELLYSRGNSNRREREIQSRPPLCPRSSLTVFEDAVQHHLRPSATGHPDSPGSEPN